MNTSTEGTLRRLPNLHFFLCVLFSLFQLGLHAQAEMICDGNTQTIAASGSFEDFVLPTDTTITQIELIAHGGDGGFANLGNGCFSEGGAGAHATARFALGDAEGALPYGSTIRFVVGVAGEKGTGGTVLGTGNTYGGGGGGTGILYKAPDSDEWSVLVVAGGGGGAYQGSIIGICVDSKTGEGGRAGRNGGNGNGANGGMGGIGGFGGLAGGLTGLEVSAGGGGAYYKGEGITCVGLGVSTEVAEGQQGYPNGGAGGGNEGCAGSTYRDGGFGFGGGASGEGGGGGGGGFSGGGGGGNAGRGGGGGSYTFASALDALIEEGGLSNLTEDGFAQYRCIKSMEPVDESPVAVCIDSIVTVSLNTAGMAMLTPALINGEALNPALNYSLSEAAFSCDSLGERSVILTVTDSEGRADFCTATVSIADKQVPELECPVSVEVNCGDDFSVDALGMARATDNCGGSALEMSEISEVGDCAGAQTITRTWTARDNSGNATTCDQVIVVSDTSAPSCDNCPEDLTVGCGSLPEMPQLEVSDNCDADPVIEVTVGSTQTADGCGAFAYTETRTWTMTDACGNAAEHTQVITVVDDQAPECLNCPAAITVSCGEVPEPASVEALDNCDLEPGVELTISSTQTGDGCSAFAYTETRTWTMTDACGNAAEYTQVITVVDDEAPECLNCPVDITVSCDVVPEPAVLEVRDNCDPEPTVVLAISSTQASDRSCGAFAYTETRTWTISDACGNTIEQVQVITVEDTTAPEIACPPAITVTCDSDPGLAGFPEVTDNCDPATAITYEDVILSGDCDWDCLMERTWTATDVCGNSSSCVQTIEQSVLELMEDALSEDLDGDALADPLVIGRLNRHSLTVTAEGAACLLAWLPNAGGKAWPLVRKDFLVDGSDCSPDGLPVGEDGKLNNPLIAETLVLGIKLRLDPDLAEVPLSDLDCDLHPLVFQGLPRNPTISDLYHQANLVVGNIISLPFTEYFVAALTCVNATYGLCPDETAGDARQLAGYPALEVATVGQLLVEIAVYPNPARDQFWLDLSAFSGQNGQLSLFNATGQRVLDRQLRSIGTEPMAFPTDELSNGLYLLRIRVGDRIVTEQLVVQGK